MSQIQLIKVKRDFKEIEKIYNLNEEAFPKEERIPREKFLNLIYII